MSKDRKTGEVRPLCFPCLKKESKYRYSWTCEKCNEHQLSNHNVCKTCGQVFFGSDEIICERCGKPPIGNSDFGSARALRTLSMKEVQRWEYGQFHAPELVKELFELLLYVGKRLCRTCHPDGFSSGTGLTSKFYLAEEQDENVRKAYQDLADRIRADIKNIKSNNPKMSEDELIKAARFLMKTKYKKALREDAFEYDRLEAKIRHAVHKSVPSNVFLRKLTKEELHAPILRPDYERIEAARQSMNLIEYGRVVADESKQINKRVRNLLDSLTKRGGGKKIDSAGRGGDLMGAIGEVENLIERKLREITFLERRIGTTEPASVIEKARSKAYDTVDDLKKKLEETIDPVKRKEVGIELTRAQSELTDWSNRAESIPYDNQIRQRIDSITEGIFRLYKPLLDAARNIIDWDPIGHMMTDEVRPTPFSFYPLSAEHVEDARGERVWDIDLAWPARPEIEARTCEICRERSVSLKATNVPVTRFKNVEKGDDILRPMSLYQISKSTKSELRKSLITLSLCFECRSTPDILTRYWDNRDTLKYESDFNKRLVLDKKIDDGGKLITGMLRDQCRLVLEDASDEVRVRFPVQDCAPALWYDDATHEHELWVIGVLDARVGLIEFPKSIKVHERDVNLSIVPRVEFMSTYFWAVLGLKGRQKWQERAMERGRVTYIPNPSCEMCEGTGKTKHRQCECIRRKIDPDAPKSTMKFGPFGLVYGGDRYVRDPEAIAAMLKLELPYTPMDWSGPPIDDCELWDEAEVAVQMKSQQEKDLPADYYRITDPFYYARRSAVASFEELVKEEDRYAAQYAQYLADLNRKPATTPPPKGGFHLMTKLRTFPIMMVGRRAMRQEKGFRRHAATPEEVVKWNREKAAETLKNREEFNRALQDRKEKAKQLKLRKRIVVRLPKRKKKR
jgi:hypothetical protein